MIEYSSDDLPDIAQFTDNYDGSGTFIWQTTTDDAGSYSALFSLSNGVASASTTVSIIVIAPALPPELSDDFQSEQAISAGELLEFNISGNDPGGLDLMIAFSSDDLPDYVQFTDNFDGTGSFSWQTTSDDVGSYTARFTLSNGETETSGEVSIEVMVTDQPPQWVDVPPEIVVNEGEIVEFTLIGTDPDFDVMSIEFSSDELPIEAVMEDFGDGTGTFTWQTTNGDVGVYTAKFVITSNQLSAEAEVTITVNETE